MYCIKCNSFVSDNASFCGNCGHPTADGIITLRQENISSSNRLVYILLALFLGTLGIHNFYAGRIGSGVAQLLLTILIGWLIAPLFGVGFWVLLDICFVKHDGNGRRFQ